MSEHTPNKLKSLKTGGFERRWSLAKASLVAGTRLATASAASMFSSEEEKGLRRKRAMAEQAEYLVREMGKLKGSIVKIGQMMALYGEHFLPPEVTRALHQLNDNTVALHWDVIEQYLMTELGEKRYGELIIDPEPLGAASLAQVHRAVRKSDGTELVLKIQYPGVADAIDSDLSLVAQMMRLARVVPQTREFEEWLEEVRLMMHREVNYPQEMETTRLFHEHLKGDKRYIVPHIYPDYSTEKVIAMSYEHGVPINSNAIMTLSQERRNRLAEASLEICCREVFEWGEMQTDPNFGNYLVRLGDGTDTNPDQIVLLDFGAVRDFPDDLLNLARGLTRAAFFRNMDGMLDVMQSHPFFLSIPVDVRRGLAELFFLAVEPFSDMTDVPAEALTADGRYIWAKANLHNRVMAKAARSAATRHFTVPPKELMFISRKFVGAYTFMTVIDAQIHSRPMLEHYLQTA
ncbi:ABC1 family protein [Fluviicoccus keumensis]|uniref:ABC1 family protein n=1 Tax=Fluviicoccus keumensis TaxID=1435465 RepID=A0A4Q7Z9W1_9GAMM|nr:AarF/ABC1/UbiB kinase family protein [Fluviicoccus keumensis]RZU46854.1 ABC1 family protein [Fluviicoccus keumensis]